MLDAKNIMLHFMAKSGQWEDAHATSIASFFYNLETHQRKDQKNGKKTLLLYQSRVRREWFNALKRGEGFNIELIEDDLLRDYAEEISESIRDSENAARDREVEQVRLYSPVSPGSKLTSSPLFFLILLKPPPCAIHASPTHHVSPYCTRFTIRRYSLPFAITLSPFVPILTAMCFFFSACQLLPRYVPFANCRPVI